MHHPVTYFRLKILANCIITRFLVWKPGGKSPLGRPGHKWEIILKWH